MNELVWIASGRNSWSMRVAFRRAHPELRLELEKLHTRFADAAGICERLASYVGDRICVADARPATPLLHAAWLDAIAAWSASAPDSWSEQFCATVDAMLVHLADELSLWELQAGDRRWDALGERRYLDWESSLPPGCTPSCLRKRDPVPSIWVRARLEQIALTAEQRARLRRLPPQYA